MAKPGFYWYSGDWKKDTCMLSLIAKGGWHELLLTLHETGGTVTWPLETYARFWSISNELAVQIIDELERYNVANVEWLSTGYPQENGWQTDGKPMANGMAKAWQKMAKLSCRRMMRTVEKKSHIQEVRSEAGKLGAKKRWQKWHPSLSSSLNLNIRRRPHKNEVPARDGKKISAPFREFSDYFCAAFQTKFGQKYIFQKAKDAEAIKRMLIACELAQLKELADKFFQSPDPFIKQSGYTLGVFESQLKKLSIVDRKETTPPGWDQLRRFAKGESDEK